MENLTESEIIWVEEQIILNENDKTNCIFDELVINLNEKIDTLTENYKKFDKRIDNLEIYIKQLNKSDKIIESKFDKINYKNKQLNEENNDNLKDNLKDIILKNDETDLKFQKIYKTFYLFIFIKMVCLIMF